MALDTDLSKSPYFDDYDEEKNFHQILYRPTYPVQTRELNQTQSIFQNQISRFGRHVFQEGSIVEGCALSFDSKVDYVKINDNYSNNTTFNIQDFVGKNISSNNGLSAIIVGTSPGFISQSPDLNTLYIKYISSSNDSMQKRFNNDDLLTISTSEGQFIGEIQVANSISSGSSNSTGYGYIVHAQSGLLFQKGYIIRTDEQSLVVSKYNNNPNNISVGFQTLETIVTPEIDTSLLDNAAGAPNYEAPGAHRLKLTPTLVYRTTSDISNTSSFFSIVDFTDGNPSIVRTDPSYAALGKQLAQRTNEESGSYIIEPFNIRLENKYFSNGNIDTNNLKVNIDPGLAYINGYRVQTIGKLTSDIRKGNDVKYVNQQTVTTTLGNYVFVNELGGIFGFQNLQTVSLRDSTAQVGSVNISQGDSVNSVSAPGNEIGTAKVIAIEYDSGVQYTPEAVYRLYLIDISMNSGMSFANVKSLYASDGTSKGFADTVLENGSSVLKESTLQPLVYNFNQRAIKTLKNANGSINTQFDLRASNSVSFNTSGVATITVPTRVGGTNQFPYGTGVLSNNNEKDFILIAKSDALTSNNTGTVSTSGNTVTGVSTTFTTVYNVGQLINIANTSSSSIVRISAIANNTSMTVTPSPTAFTGVDHCGAFVTGEIIDTTISSATITIDSPTGATINLGKTLSSTLDAQVIYNIRRVQATQTKKNLQDSVFIKIDCSNNTSNTVGPWSLGLPDVFEIKNAWVGTTYSNTNINYANSFTLNSGTKDTYYGLSTISAKGVPLTSSSKILLEVKAYIADTSQGIGFFSIDSYPIDDTGLAANTILTQDIGIYTSNTSGQSYDLRNTVDFRIYVSNTASYSNTIASATINPSATQSFATGVGNYIPAVDSSFEADLQYYVGRNDLVAMTSTGKVIVKEGGPSENPVAPDDVPDSLIIASLQIPPYPTLINKDALSADRIDYSVNLQYRKNRRYTMNDVGGLDRRITTLEYYTTLSLLETTSKELLITDDSGNNRFKYGFLAEPFNGHDIGDTKDPQYQISIDSTNSEARPLFEQNLFDLKYSSGVSTEISSDGRLITLPKSVVTGYITQPFASKVRNCVQDIIYQWSGNIQLTPEGDFYPDVTINPQVSVNLDTYSNWVNIANAWGTVWGEWDETVIGSTTTNGNGNGRFGGFGSSVLSSNGDRTITTTTTTTTTIDANRSGTQLSVSPETNDYNFGSYVSDINIQPYLRSRAVKFHAAGLKPNTRVYAYFDDTAVTQYCGQTDESGNGISYQVLTSQADGQLYGIFIIPADTFFVGDRVFKLVDIDNLVTQADVISTIATSTYHGSNISYAKNNVTLNTTTGQVTQKSVSESKVITNVDTTTNVQVIAAPAQFEGNPSGDGGGDGGGADPILQTFIIKEATNIPGIFIDSIDVYFQTKHPVLGVEMYMLDVVNGYPGNTMIPLGRKVLTSSQVNISSDSTVATRFQFDSPVFVQNNIEYSFAVRPIGSNDGYNIWVGEQGGVDVSTNSPIFTNSSIGVMFTSSTNRTWSPYQKEDIKFSINIVSFTSTSGVATVNNDDSEYLTLSSILGNYQVGEKVYIGETNAISSNANVVSNSNIITNVSTTDLDANNKIYISSNTNSIAITANIASIINSTAFTINTALPQFTDNNASVGKLRNSGDMNGIVKFIDKSKLKLYIANSSVDNTNYITNNNIIIGGTSNAYGAISTIDNITYNNLMPLFSVSTPSGTSLGFTTSGTSNNFAIDSGSSILTLGTDSEFDDYERIVMSRSNEITSLSGNKSFKININLDSTLEKLSPVIDTVKFSGIAIHNLISGEDANNSVYNSEITNSGLSLSRYITKKVVLADGQDAQDLKVYIAAYKPAGTNIYVYGKFWNSTDPEDFSIKSYTPMFTTNQVVSSRVNKNDLIEYQYSIDTTPTIDQTAYLNKSNSNVIRYVNSNGQIFDNYKIFSIKVVLVSTVGSQLVPRLGDLRAIAVSAA